MPPRVPRLLHPGFRPLEELCVPALPFITVHFHPLLNPPLLPLSFACFIPSRHACRPQPPCSASLGLRCLLPVECSDCCCVKATVTGETSNGSVQKRAVRLLLLSRPRRWLRPPTGLGGPPPRSPCAPVPDQAWLRWAWRCAWGRTLSRCRGRVGGWREEEWGAGAVNATGRRKEATQQFKQIRPC